MGNTFVLLLVLLSGIMLILHFVKNMKKKAIRKVDLSDLKKLASNDQDTKHSQQDMIQVNVYLRSYFKIHSSMQLENGMKINLTNDTYHDVEDLSFQYEDKYYDSIYELRLGNGDLYNEMFALLKDLATGKHDIKDVNKISQEELNRSTFKHQLSKMKSLIHDDEISLKLDETIQLIHQLEVFEEKDASCKSDTKKLYAYYLPMLMNILKQYVDMLAVHTNDGTRLELLNTIQAVNDAMNHILGGMSEFDDMNLSADMKTLESLMKMDGVNQSERKEEL